MAGEYCVVRIVLSSFAYWLNMFPRWRFRMVRIKLKFTIAIYTLSSLFLVSGKCFLCGIPIRRFYFHIFGKLQNLIGVFSEQTLFVFLPSSEYIVFFFLKKSKYLTILSTLFLLVRTDTLKQQRELYLHYK